MGIETKNRRSLTFFITIAVFMLGLVFAFQITTFAAPVFNDNFEDFSKTAGTPEGNIDGQNGWALTQNGSGTLNSYLVVADDPSNSGHGQCIKYVVGSNQSTAKGRADRSFANQSGTVYLEYDVYPSDSSGSTIIYVMNSSGTIAAQVDFTQNGFIRYHDGVSASTVDFSPAVSYSLNRWYHIKMVFTTNSSNATCQYYVNGNRVNTNGTNYTVRGRNSSYINMLRIGGGSSTLYYFDNAKVYKNTAPSAVVHPILGQAVTSWQLTGSYAFSDAEFNSEGSSSYQWSVSDTAEGEYSAISGANGGTFIPDDTYGGKYLKFSVTPVDENGASGTAVTSPASQQIALNEFGVTSSYNMASLEGSQQLRATVSLKKNMGADKLAQVILALYSKDNVLLNVDCEPALITSSEVTVLQPSFVLPDNVTDCRAKLFIWEGETMVPVTEPLLLK